MLNSLLELPKLAMLLREHTDKTELTLNTEKTAFKDIKHPKAFTESILPKLFTEKALRIAQKLKIHSIALQLR